MIKLSKLTDYAVVILAALARRQDKGTLMSASALAIDTLLPEPTVSKTLKLLVKGAVVVSARGVNGGYILKSTPDEILVSDIIVAMEGPIALTSCVDGSDESCSLVGQCALSGRWDIVNMALKTALDNVTLADMLSHSIAVVPSFVGEGARL